MKLELKRIIQILVVLSVLIAAFVYRTLESGGKETNAQLAQQQSAPQLNLCDFSQGCQAEVFGQKLQIKAPKNTQVLAETPIELQLGLGQGITLTKAYLKGKDMFMGTIPVIFTATDSTEPSTTQYLGELLLGACITEKMIWQLTLELDLNGQRESVEFDFEMRNH